MINPHWQIYEKYYNWSDFDIRRDLISFEFSHSEQDLIIHNIHELRKKRKFYLDLEEYLI